VMEQEVLGVSQLPRVGDLAGVVPRVSILLARDVPRVERFGAGAAVRVVAAAGEGAILHDQVDDPVVVRAVVANRRLSGAASATRTEAQASGLAGRDRGPVGVDQHTGAGLGAGTTAHGRGLTFLTGRSAGRTRGIRPARRRVGSASRRRPVAPR